MALQIDVSNVRLAPTGNGRTLTINMKCWEAGATPETDAPVIDVDRSTTIKRRPSQEVLDKAVSQIGKQFQKEIDNYNRRQVIIGKVDTEALENELTG